MEANGDTFLVGLQGRLVKCTSLADAVAVKTADALLRDGDSSTPSELQRLACVLMRYDCPSEAEQLTHKASRLRAAEFLTHTVGYRRPIAPYNRVAGRNPRA
jgi:hypothetical protein